MGRRFLATVGAVAIMGLLAACVPETPPEPAPAPVTPVAITLPPPPPPPLLPSAPGGATAPSIAPDDAPDPSVISVDPKYCIEQNAPPEDPAPTACYFAYATQVYLVPIPLWRTTDLVEWEWIGSAMPTIAPWTRFGHHWAPTVFERPNNPPESRFVMWYTARHAASGLQCLGVAVAATPLGPFVDASAAPSFCQFEYQGTIDASTFVDTDATPYLLYRSEVPSNLFIAKLAPDGRAIASGTQTLLWTGSAPDATVVEAPTMVLADGSYYLFYSTDSWSSADYRVGIARCTAALGPCARVYSSAVLSSRGSMVGPGGQTPFQDTSGSWHMLFHAWTAPKVGYPAGGARSLRLLPLTFENGTVRVG